MGIRAIGGGPFTGAMEEIADTDDVPEGASNLYYTDARAESAAPVKTVNGSTGDVTVTAPVQSVNGQTGAVTLSLGTQASKDQTISTSNPTGGSDGDVWYKVA